VHSLNSQEQVYKIVHEIKFFIGGNTMCWMTTVDVLTNQVTDLIIENMKLSDEVERLKKENESLRSELKKNEELADVLATCVFESEEQ
jgi:hydroxylamine reductase (hybrid-cluster protein)